MNERSYISQYQPVVFIGGYWVDDAQACEWQRSSPKEPLYGFRDTEFRTVATGQKLVHGILDLNFRYKGYLTLALSRLATLGRRTEHAIADGTQIPGVASGGTHAQSTPADRLQQLIHAYREPNFFQSVGVDPRRISATDRRNLLEKPFEDFDIETFTKLSEAMKDDLWSDGIDFLGVAKTEEDRTAAVDWPLPFDLKIAYDQPDPLDPGRPEDFSRVEIIRDVHFVGDSKLIANTVPGGGRAVTERYQFIARTVE